YYAEIGIGSPPQFFKMYIDTSSGDVWLPGQSCEVCATHKKFRPEASSTYKFDGRKWEISDGDGSFATGDTILDTVTVGSMSVSNQVIGLCTSESHAYQVDTTDGVLGLSYSGVSSIPGIITFVDNAYANNIFSVFSIYLHDRNENDVGGELHLGGFDGSKFQGELTWIPLYRPKLWGIILDGLSVNVAGTGKEKMEISGPAIINSGTTHIVMSGEQAIEFHRGIPSSKNSDIYGWILPCKTEQDVAGNILFTIGGADFSVPMKSLVREPVKGLDGWCSSGVTSGASNTIILGLAFLRSNYVAFDRSNARVGIAPSSHQPPPRSNSPAPSV
ncbi:acid protease, partial [Linnemannia elongata AG-77]